MIRINLALQGGGAHGAFTWGVLDRLLAEPGIEIAAMSGTSAGALNGAAVKSALVQGDSSSARAKLNWLWEQISGVDSAAIPEWMRAWLPDPAFMSKALEYSPGFAAADLMGRTLSPYSWGPLYKNPLRPIVEQFDFGKICARSGPELFVCATQVREGKVRIFKGDKITTEAIMASACLPTLFQAVETEDPETGQTEAFWDGGYTGNPALFPLFDRDLPQDIVIININPLRREALPVTPPEIQNRINEISFNSSLLRELRAIAFVQKLTDEGRLAEDAMRAPRIHMISDDALMNDLSVATKMVPVPSVIAQLKEAGQNAAEQFLTKHKAKLGKVQTANLRQMFG